MADDDARPSSRFAGLRIVLLLSGLILFTLAALSLLGADRLHTGLAWYAERAGAEPSQPPDEGLGDAVRKTLNKLTASHPDSPLQANDLGLYLVRLGLAQLALPGLACLLAMASPIRQKGLLVLLILYGLICAAAAGGFGFYAGVHLMLYGVPTLAALLFTVLLVALYPYGYTLEQAE